MLVKIRDFFYFIISLCFSRRKGSPHLSQIKNMRNYLIKLRICYYWIFRHLTDTKGLLQSNLKGISDIFRPRICLGPKFQIFSFLFNHSIMQFGSSTRLYFLLLKELPDATSQLLKELNRTVSSLQRCESTGDRTATWWAVASWLCQLCK